MGNIQITSPGIKRALRKWDAQEAIAEYIWNGFDAEATCVNLIFEANSIDTITDLRIVDNGYGVPFDDLKRKFDPFFESEKVIDPNRQRTTSAVHGKNGVGRLTFFAFALKAQWETVYSSGGRNFTYTIAAGADTLNTYSASEPVQTDQAVGTCAIFTGIHDLTAYAFESSLREFLAKEFGWFIELNACRGYALRINGKDLDYSGLIGDRETFVHPCDGDQFEIRYVRWNASLREYSRYYFIGSDNVERHKEATTLNNKGDQFYHSVFIKSSFFDEYFPVEGVDEEAGTQLGLEDHTGKGKKLALVKRTVDRFLRDKRKPFLRAYTDLLITEYEREGVFPQLGNNQWDKFRKDQLEQVVRELYQVEPKLFSNLNTEQKRTLVRLLNLVMDSNERDSLLGVIAAIVELDASERKCLASLLTKTSLSSVIATIKLLEDRFEVIEDLKALVFDELFEANESHLQAIIENHYWIFGEQYHLVTAEEPDFEEALRRYNGLLRGDSTRIRINHPDKNKEMDIFAVRRDVGSDSISHIVVELKHPDLKLGAKQLSQVKTYMGVVRQLPEFNGANHFWQFILVGTDFDSTGALDLELKNATNHGERYLAFKAENYKIYIKKWSEVFGEFDTRHKYLYEQLKLRRERLISVVQSASQIVESASANSAVQPPAVDLAGGW